MKSCSMNPRESLRSKTLDFLFALVSFCALPGLAAAASKGGGGNGRNTIELGTSMLSHGLNHVAINETGASGFLGTNYFELQMQAHIRISDQLYLAPLALYMPSALLPYSAPGGYSKNSYAMIALPVVQPLSTSWSLQYGPALLIYTIKGNGGTTTLNNGTSTATFAVPARTVEARTLGLLVGPEYTYEQFHFALSVIGEDIFNKGKRDYSLLISISSNVLKF